MPLLVIRNPEFAKLQIDILSGTGLHRMDMQQGPVVGHELVAAHPVHNGTMRGGDIVQVVNAAR